MEAFVQFDDRVAGDVDGDSLGLAGRPGEGSLPFVSRSPSLDLPSGSPDFESAWTFASGLPPPVPIC